MSRLAALIANLSILGFLGFSAWLEAAHPNLYYASAQEDQALEWASFWSFFAASICFVAAARRQRRATGALPWFLAGLALFCFLVAAGNSKDADCNSYSKSVDHWSNQQLVGGSVIVYVGLVGSGRHDLPIRVSEY